jgi:hypothetical protein
MREEREYRCTRNEPYDNPGCPGHLNSSARQGHYIFAKTALLAAIKMFTTYPEDALYGFTIADKEKESMMWTWSFIDGLNFLYDEEGISLSRLFSDIRNHIGKSGGEDIRIALSKICISGEWEGENEDQDHGNQTEDQRQGAQLHRVDR